MPCRDDRYECDYESGKKINELEDMLCYICSKLKDILYDSDFSSILSNKPELEEWYEQHVKADKDRVLKYLKDANFDLSDKRDRDILKGLLDEN